MDILHQNLLLFYSKSLAFGFSSTRTNTCLSQSAELYLTKEEHSDTQSVYVYTNHIAFQGFGLILYIQYYLFA